MWEGKINEIELECPFCKVGKIKVFRKESYAKPRLSRISGGKRTIRYEQVSAQYIITENCPNCGKTKKEIQKAIDTGKTKELTHEERIEMLKKRGLPIVLGYKKKNV